MQTGKNAMASAKETASNIGATAKSGMDKTKAVVQEKVEKVTAHHPAEKEMAEQRKQEKIQEAEIQKQQAVEYNAAAKEQARTGYSGGPVGVATAHNPPASAVSSHVPGEPAGGHVTSGVVESRPIGRETGTGRPSAAHNPLAGSTHPAVHGTGGGYN